MTFSKAQRWLLLAAALLTLPVVVAAWWMVSWDHSATPAGEPGEHGRKIASSGDAVDGLPATRAGRSRAAPDAPETTAGKDEANDFRAFASGLKAQGYPDKTVRELVASRITADFQNRRTAIRRQSRQDNGTAADLQQQLAALSCEQGALIAQLVGAEERPAETAADAAAAETARSGGEKQILMPAVMADAIPAQVKSDQQAAEWGKLRTDFVNAIGGENQDPENPQYRKRWAQAESASDQRFRLVFGDSAFVQHQLKAQQEALLRAQGAGTH